MLLMLAKHIPANAVSAENKTNNSLDTLCHQLGDAAVCQDLSDRYHAFLNFRRDFHTRVGQLLLPAASPPGMFVWPMSPADESGMEIAWAEIEEIQASMRRVAARVAASEGAHVIVFGHTHRPCIESLEDGTTLVNCGSWQWLGGYDPTEVDVWRKLLVGSIPITPRHRLTYTRIDYDEQDVPHAQLLNFAEEQERNSSGDQVMLGRMLSWLRQVLGNIRNQ
jgi:hypothetical protein